MSNVTQINNSLSNVSVLIKLSSTEWTASKKDKSKSAEVSHDAGAQTKDAARVYKSLLPSGTTHTAITSKINEARRAMYALTVPWSDGGDRLLPATAMQEMTDMLDKYTVEIDGLVNTLCVEYDQEIRRAAFMLGGMFNANDYPSVDEVRSKYSFGYSISPLPSSGDFRVDLPAQMMGTLRAAYERDANSRINVAMREVWTRVHDKLVHLVDRLTDNADGKRQVFRGGLLESAQELCDQLRHLNMTNDTNLEAARVALVNALRGLSTDQVRESVTLRDNLRQDVQVTLDKFSALGCFS